MSTSETPEGDKEQKIAEKLEHVESGIKDLISLVPKEKRGQAFISLVNLVLATDGLYQLDLTDSGPKIMKALMKVTEELARKS